MKCFKNVPALGWSTWQWRPSRGGCRGCRRWTGGLRGHQFWPRQCPIIIYVFLDMQHLYLSPFSSLPLSLTDWLVLPLGCHRNQKTMIQSLQSFAILAFYIGLPSLSISLPLLTSTLLIPPLPLNGISTLNAYIPITVFPKLFLQVELYNAAPCKTYLSDSVSRKIVAKTDRTKRKTHHLPIKTLAYLWTLCHWYEIQCVH